MSIPEALKPNRLTVFVVEQGFSIDDEIDEYDKKAVFFLLNVLEENEDGSNKRIPIGTVRIVPGINKVGTLLRICPRSAVVVI